MEVAAGVIVAEQAISTTIEGAALGAVALAKPTLPLKAHFTRFATTPDKEPLEPLHVSRHSISVVNGRAYIFGGQLSDGRVAGNEMHIFDLGAISQPLFHYKRVPAVVSSDTKTVPSARYGHSTQAIGTKIYLFGGRNDSSVVEDKNFWSFDTESLLWECVEVQSPSNAPEPRHNFGSTTYGDAIVIYGGLSKSDSTLKDTWTFHSKTQNWSRAPDLELFASGSSPSIAEVDHNLYVIDHTAKGEVVLHVLDLTSALSTWRTTTFALEIPHPQPRIGASILSVDTGSGRKYLLYVLGEGAAATLDNKTDSANEFRSDVWAYQLPAPSKTAAAIKDSTNEGLGFNSDRSIWAEVIVQPDEETSGLEGKSHPGPRAYFASAIHDSQQIVLWGGITGKGTTEGDGWIIKIE